MLTRKQLDLLNLINRRIQRDGVPPSFDEMKDALGLRSKSGIHRLITALEERGFIRRLAHKARAIEIVKLPDALERDNVDPGLSGSFTPTLVADSPARRGRDPDDPGDNTPRVDHAGAYGGVSGNVSRGVKGEIPRDRRNALDLPVMGRIAAGTPIEAISHKTDSLSVPAAMLRARGLHYALEVKGDSMIGAGINDGDIVVIREQEDADNGDIVVALIEGQEATLKRLRKHGRSIALEAANPAYETRVYRDDQVRVQGRLVGLIRTY